MAELRAHSFELVVEVRREILAAVAQRGQGERPQRQAREQVVAKPPGADERREIAIGARDQLEVARGLPVTADRKLFTERHQSAGHAMRVHQLGTLGTGNHFIELCLDEAGAVWVMLHSGSRGIGNRIGTYFIERAKADMRRWFINLPDDDLAYIPEGSELFKDYVLAVEWAQDYARTNRELMMQNTIQALRALGTLPEFEAHLEAVNCHHNYISREKHYGESCIVTRKGACARGSASSGSSRAAWVRSRSSCAARETPRASTAAAMAPAAR